MNARWRAVIERLMIRARRTMPGADRTLEALIDGGFTAIDVETTGLDPRRDALVSAAAVPFVGGIARPPFATLVAPGRPIPAAASAVHGITDDDVRHAPAAHAVVAELDGRCAGRVLVGHDIAFDLSVLATVRAAHGLPAPQILALDTRRLVRALEPAGYDSRLEAVAARLGVSTAGRHTAEGDARMAGLILLALVPALRARGARTVGDLLRLEQTAARYD